MKNIICRTIPAVLIITSMLAGILAAKPALSESGATITLMPYSWGTSAYMCGYPNIYKITLTTSKPVIVEGKIRIVFPAGTDLRELAPSPSADLQIQTSLDTDGSAITLCLPDYIITGSYPNEQTLEITIPEPGIGSNSIVEITAGTINGIFNPTIPGEYKTKLYIHDSISGFVIAALGLGPYTLDSPWFGGSQSPPPFASGYDSSGKLLATSNYITAIINTPGVVTITLEPGIYFEDVILNQPNIKSIVSASSNSEKYNTRIAAAWSKNKGGTFTITASPAEGLIIDGLTLDGNDESNTIMIAPGNKVTIKNCYVLCQGATGINMSGENLELSNVAFHAGGIISDPPCTYLPITHVPVTIANIAGLNVDAGVTNLSNCVFSDGISGIAANITGGTVTFTSCIFSDCGGTGIHATGGITTLDSCTLTNLIPALKVTYPAEFTIKNSTIDACGNADFLIPAINIRNANHFDVFNSIIKNSQYWIANISGGDNRFMFNDFSTGNTKGFTQTGGKIALQHNWWGQASGAVIDFNDDNIDPSTETSLPLGSAPDSANVRSYAPFTWTVADAVAASSVGNVAIPSIVVTGIDDVSTTVTGTGAASFTDCPTITAPNSLMTIVRYFDVFINDAAATKDTATIHFYGNGLTSNARIFYWNSMFERWYLCSNQTVDESRDYVIVVLNNVTFPVLSEVTGSYFALLDGADTPGVPIAELLPMPGATDASVNPTFTWPIVADAKSYKLEISEEPSFDNPSVKNTITNIYTSVYTLKYDTQYWWRVKAVKGPNTASEWTTSFFKTIEEPATSVIPSTTDDIPLENTPASSNNETEPSPNSISVLVPPTNPQTTPATYVYIFWAIVGIAVVLIIIMVVLIVRIRKTNQQ